MYNDFCIGMCKWTDCPDKPRLCTRFAYLPLSILLTPSGPDMAGRQAYALLGSIPNIAYSSKPLLDLPTCLWILLTLKYLQNSQRTKVSPILLAFVTVKIAVILGNGRPEGMPQPVRVWCRNTDSGWTCPDWAWTSNQIYVARIYNSPLIPLFFWVGHYYLYQLFCLNYCLYS